MRAQRVRGGESRVEMQFAKWTAEGAVAVVISIGSISAYKYITSPKEESIPLETTLEDAAELTTQKIQAVPDSRKMLETRRLPERMKAHRLNQTAIVRQTVHRITHPRTTQHSQAQHRTTQLPSRQQLMRRVRRMRKRLRQEMYWRFTKVRQSKVLRC